MRKIIPLSTNEAIRLYNCGHQIVKMDTLKSPMSLVPLNADEEYFNELRNKTCWALYLPKDESEKINETQTQRFRRTVAGIFSLTWGIALLTTYYNQVFIKFTSIELLGYGVALLVAGVGCFVKLFMSLEKEKKAWQDLFKKYDAWDYYKS